MSQAYDDLIDQLAVHLGLDAPTLRLTQEIVIDDLPVGLQFEGDEQGGDIVLFCGLGQPPEHRLAQVYSTLLQANCFWIGTGGATLSVQPESQQVLMCARQPLEDQTPEYLARVLDVFVDAGLYWQGFIAGTLVGEEGWPPEVFTAAA